MAARPRKRSLVVVGRLASVSTSRVGTPVPVPIRMTRYMGHTPLEQLASEVLGLSKMDWNSFDLYSQMPATLESSGAIARIGQLLSRFGTEMYDYRLFM